MAYAAWVQGRTNCRDRCDNLAQLQLVEDRRLAGCIKPHHQDAHLLLGEEALEHTLEGPHGCRQAIRTPLAAGVLRVPLLSTALHCHVLGKV